MKPKPNKPRSNTKPPPSPKKYKHLNNYRNESTIIKKRKKKTGI